MMFPNSRKSLRTLTTPPVGVHRFRLVAVSPEPKYTTDSSLLTHSARPSPIGAVVNSVVIKPFVSNLRTFPFSVSRM